jgi:hypothetical protein
MGSGGMIYVPSFMKIGTGVEAISRFYLSNFKGCNVGISNGRDLWFCFRNLRGCNDIIDGRDV